MFERFTARARQVVAIAQTEAQLHGNKEIGYAHLLAACAIEGDGLAASILAERGVSAHVARATYPSADAEPGEPPTQRGFTPEAKRVLELALREALSLGHSYIGTEHILLALERAHPGLGVGVEGELRDEVLRRLLARSRGEQDVRAPRGEPTARELLEEDVRDLQRELDALHALQMELARRGFLSTVATFRVNHEARSLAPAGDKRLRTLSGWHGRLNVRYELFDRQAMDVLTGLAADHGCALEWSAKHGATFRPKDDLLDQVAVVAT